MKLCNKAISCKYHENRCDHRKLHSSYEIECDPKMRESAGLQPNCYHYPDQICVEFNSRATKLGRPCKSEAKDIARHEGGNE